ncbi:hypothetical protein KC367_g9258 [Hortaea werneckii]|nr:hypothetical protein KC367_g9258 [Hortaea werneckii]
MNETPYTTLPTGPVFPPTTPRIDARNWARLPPFRDLGQRRPAGSRQDGVTVQKEGDEVVGGGGSGGEGKDDLSPQQDGDIGAEAGRRGSSRVRGGGGGGGGGGVGHLEEEEKIEMEMARLLLSKSRWKAEVMDRFVCMRWKEKCFVENFPSPSSSSSRKGGKRGSGARDGTGESKEEGDQSSVHPHERAGPHDVGLDHDGEVDPAQEEEEEDDDQQQPQQQQGHGLTISGFYYIVLDRQTGGVEGLYYDPASTPFQRLKLRGCSSGQRWRPSGSGHGGGGVGKTAGNGGGNGNGGGGMVWPAVGFA